MGVTVNLKGVLRKPEVSAAAAPCRTHYTSQFCLSSTVIDLRSKRFSIHLIHKHFPAEDGNRDGMAFLVFISLP